MTLQRAAVLVLLLTSCGPMGKPSENAPTVATVDPARITIPLPRRGNISYCSTCFTNDQEPARVAPLRRYWSPDASRLLLISDAAHCRLALLAVQPGRANRDADLPHEVSDDRSESAFRAAVESVAAAIGGEVQSVAQLEHVPEDARLAPDGILRAPLLRNVLCLPVRRNRRATPRVPRHSGTHPRQRPRWARTGDPDLPGQPSHRLAALHAAVGG